MLQGWVIIAVALGYISLLFVVASYGDRTRRFGRSGGWRHLIYPLSLAIYCTSWTFFGSVGLASRTGFYDFLTIYLGPMIMIGVCSPLIMRIVRKIYYRLVSRFANINVPPDVGEFQLVDRAVVEALRRCDDYYPYIRGLIANCGFRSMGVAYIWKERARGISKNRLYHLVDQGLNGLISFTNIPMRICLLIGFVLSSLRNRPLSASGNRLTTSPMAPSMARYAASNSGSCFPQSMCEFWSMDEK